MTTKKEEGKIKAYIVGGYVRDRELARRGLALPPGDRDWVVVGATPEAMAARGFIPVGSDFPVFLHPRTHEEHALARTERKTAPGYHGFVFHASPEVTLEEDLRRRDLTINAVALDPETGETTDPYGGFRDLEAKVLRHVSPAFAEDPVRILRVARFAAKMPDFSVAPETMALMRGMVASGEADHLVAERVWKEWSRSLEYERPARTVAVLAETGLWEKLFASVDPARVEDVLEKARGLGLGVEALCGAVAAALPDPKPWQSALEALRAPKSVTEFTLMVARSGGLLEPPASAGEALEGIRRMDALRRPERFEAFLELTEKLAKKDCTPWRRALETMKAVDLRKVAASVEDKRGIPEAIRKAYLERLETLFSK